MLCFFTDLFLSIYSKNIRLFLIEENMKKILSLSLVALFSLTGYSFAATTTVEKETKKAVNNTKYYVQKKANDTGKTVNKAAKKLSTDTKKAVNHTKNYVKKKTNDINAANKKTGQKIENSVKKTINDIKKNTK